MKFRLADKPRVTGSSSSFNLAALCEVVVGFDAPNEDMDTVPCHQLEVWLESKQEWKRFNRALDDRDVIPDNYNSHFREPRNEEERKRGYYS